VHTVPNSRRLEDSKMKTELTMDEKIQELANHWNVEPLLIEKRLVDHAYQSYRVRQEKTAHMQKAPKLTTQQKIDRLIWLQCLSMMPLGYWLKTKEQLMVA